MSRVAIVDQSTSKFTKDAVVSLEEIACEPCKEILARHKNTDLQIDSVFLSTTADIQYGSTIVSEYLGLKPRISQRLDNLCNSECNCFGILDDKIRFV